MIRISARVEMPIGSMHGVWTKLLCLLATAGFLGSAQQMTAITTEGLQLCHSGHFNVVLELQDQPQCSNVTKEQCVLPSNHLPPQCSALQKASMSAA